MIEASKRDLIQRDDVRSEVTYEIHLKLIESMFYQHSEAIL